ncbi:MAG: glycosyltransferase family 2 protein [Clostridia bacterium]|nr:glycosyltransferase family 2 protein [Clostridia bacterium]
MDKPLISVIVPIYKVEQYLKRCLDSIINQTYKNLEIILVDDGSPDRCGEMCDEFSKADSRIRVVHKINGGLSSARNAGLDIMTGEYVGFVDSDDWIESEMFEKLYELLVSNGAQIAACGTGMVFSSGEVHYLNSDYPQDKKIEIYQKQDAFKELILNQKITNSVCDKLFSKQIFDELRFKEGIIYEDFEIMPKCLEKIKMVVYTPTPFYYYVMTDNSISRDSFKENKFIIDDISRNNMEFYNQNYPELSKCALAKHVELCLGLIYESTGYKQYYERRRKLIRQVKNIKIKDVFCLLNTKNKVKYILAKINISLYVFAMNLKKSF